MPLPEVDPSLPSLPSPLFSDIDAVRGDHMRANNQKIWTNLQYLFDFTGRTTDTLTEGSTNHYYPQDDETKLAGIATGADVTANAIGVLGAVFAGEFGLTLSNNAGQVINVAAGACWDSTRLYRIVLGAFTGSLAGTFTAGTGNNKLDAGSVANNTTYHIYAIAKAAGVSPDILFSTSATNPTMPATYTLKRRIGSMYTDGSGNWRSFTQFGNYFQWVTPPKDIDATNPGTSAVLRTLTTPLGIQTLAQLEITINEGGGAGAVYFSSPAQSDAAPSFPLATVVPSGAGTGYSNGSKIILTDTSSQIRTRNELSGNGERIASYTIGWTDIGIVGLGI